MGRGGAVHFQSRQILRRVSAARGAEIIVGIGQVDEIALHVRAIAFARLEVAGSRLHEEIPRPQCAQIHVDAALHVDEQRALALLLQHGLRFLGLQAEVVGLLRDNWCGGRARPTAPSGASRPG